MEINNTINSVITADDIINDTLTTLQNYYSTLDDLGAAAKAYIDIYDENILKNILDVDVLKKLMKEKIIYAVKSDEL